MSEKSNNSYEYVLKSISIFSGVQVFNILISLIKSKIIAYLLGPIGFGVSGIISSTGDFLSSLVNLVISSSGVRHISQATKEKEVLKITESITIVKKIVIVTGLFGLIITLVLSPVLSQISFGNDDYIFAFIWLSVSIFFQQLALGRFVILQGLQKIKILAFANVLGASLGLLISIPLYLIFKINAIAPAILCTSFTNLVVAYIYTNKLKYKTVKIPLNKLLTDGANLINLGVFFSLSSLTSIGGSYILRIYIGKSGGLEQVGLFTAGFAMVNTYVGVIFQAMSTDYFPRLSAEIKNLTRSKIIVNQQAEISMLIIGPVLCFFLIFSKLFITLLFTEKFLGVINMINFAALGIYFKCPAWALSFVYLSKGNTKYFFFNELFANIYILLLNLLGYWSFGLEGLGVSFLIGYVLYFIQTQYIVRKRFSIFFNKQFVYIFSVNLLFGLFTFYFVKYCENSLYYYLSFCFAILSLLYSFIIFRNRLSFKIDRK